ncbi:alpha/beta hydrolase [Aphanothece hegewaldii CCALA 016]|uniref:Alpha/beta hydrolase n=1 Tax=Aphanothece hegewaldii CCALA 016 TaxID=2107694 RepID=A0A2T1LRK0_9CHRO|nr:alpha/beta fold hydrolase [Aphanothece hegewaldii]PSF31342.1 alpha/beta hydrolase [Aphanothece hegewaldii CCALA 016]
MTISPIASDISPKTWLWKGYTITYQQKGENGPAVILIHGFGASWGHWRKNLSELGNNCRCYAIDLIGFGGSAKPTPNQDISYTFETWAQQIADFCQEVVGKPVFLVGNSIGCIVAMQMAVDYPELVTGVAALNCSLRLLHEKKRASIPWYRNVGASFAQNILKNRFIAQYFFQQIARPKTIKKILSQAYRNTEAITDELIDIILKPAQDSGAVDVFIAFTGYSQGPLAEDLLPLISCPTYLLWGTEDPWEPIELGKKLADYPSVKQFIPLEGLGHCPQDEDPKKVNEILQKLILENHDTAKI